MSSRPLSHGQTRGDADNAAGHGPAVFPDRPSVTTIPPALADPGSMIVVDLLRHEAVAHL